jgi:hypothetical protein
LTPQSEETGSWIGSIAQKMFYKDQVKGGKDKKITRDITIIKLFDCFVTKDTNFYLEY